MRITAPVAALFVIVFLLLPAQSYCAQAADQGVFVVPESERPLDFVVIGLWSNNHKYICMPEVNWPKSASLPQKREIEKQLYWINLEFTHGEILQKLPAYTKIFVAVPNSASVNDATGDEKSYFIDYLKARCGFTDAGIKLRVKFFHSSAMIVWPQDMCKVIGYDRVDGRVAIARSAGDADIYVKVTKELTDAFPETFVLKDVDKNTSAEGGDEDIIKLPGPGHKVAIITGRHRVQRYAERVKGVSFDRAPIDDAMKAEAAAAFSKSYFGVEAVFLPEEIMKKPEKGSEEVFHLDMVTSILPDPKGGKPKAFIPSIANNCYVSLNDEQLNKEFVSHIQAEYDAAASQMRRLGFDTPRLYYCDHPVRGPVNIIKYHDKISGGYSVMLGKYPNHLPVDDPYTAQHRVTDIFKLLANRFNEWSNKQDAATYKQLKATMDGVWTVMDTVSEETNSVYDEQKKMFEKYGYNVITVPVYAWGAGGLHCMVMY